MKKLLIISIFCTLTFSKEKVSYNITETTGLTLSLLAQQELSNKEVLDKEARNKDRGMHKESSSVSEKSHPRHTNGSHSYSGYENMRQYRTHNVKDIGNQICVNPISNQRISDEKCRGEILRSVNGVTCIDRDSGHLIDEDKCHGKLSKPWINKLLYSDASGVLIYSQESDKIICVDYTSGEQISFDRCEDKVHKFGAYVRRNDNDSSCINPRNGDELDMKYCEGSKYRFGLFKPGLLIATGTCINPLNGKRLDKIYCTTSSKEKGKLIQLARGVKCINSSGAQISMEFCKENIGGFGKLITQNGKVLCVNSTDQRKINMKYCSDEIPHFGFVKYVNNEATCIDIIEGVLIDDNFCSAKFSMELLTSSISEDLINDETDVNDARRFHDVVSRETRIQKSFPVSIGK